MKVIIKHPVGTCHLVLPVVEADHGGQGERRLRCVAAALDSVTGHVRQVGDVRDEGKGAIGTPHGLVQDLQDSVNWTQTHRNLLSISLEVGHGGEVL